MISLISPGPILLLGALLLPFLPARARGPATLILPLLALVGVTGLWLSPAAPASLSFMGLALDPVRVDPLANLFGLIFSLAACLSALYALPERSLMQQMASLAYAGAALAAVYAGDLLTLFVFWELTALAAAFVIWAGGSDRAYRAGLRYLYIQIAGGVVLMAGILLQLSATGSLAFARLDPAAGLGPALILVGFGVKAAFPFLHNWLQDSYPEASPAGSVWLSAFSTKLAIYALARGYPGTELLLWIGCAMTVFPIFYAVLENDLRRVLAYSLNNQLGFMVAGIGIGTELALNGALAHAFCHIIYKALLFMAMGAVLHRTGTTKASELGGLYKCMPWTAGFCLVGSASISAFPLFSGFIAKSLILAAVAEQGHPVAWLILLFASAGVLDHSGIKVPFFSFFAHDQGHRVAEAPWPMLAAMALASALCIGLGVFPGLLYGLLPFPVDYQPYTLEHVLTQSQLLLFAMLAFVTLWRTGLYPPELPAVNLDFDVVYRKGLPALAAALVRTFSPLDRRLRQAGRQAIAGLADQLQRRHGLARTVGAGGMVFWVLVMLAGYLVLALTGLGQLPLG